MSYTTFQPIAVYPADGDRTVFPIPDRFYSAVDIQVFNVVDGVEAQVDPSDFSVQINFTEPTPPSRNGGNVVFGIAPAEGNIVVMIWPPNDQDQRFEGRPVTPRERERVHDRHSMRDAAMRELFFRGFRSPLDTPPALRYIGVGVAGEVPQYDENGNLIPGANIGEIAAIAAIVDQINTVAGISTEVVTVAALQTEIEALYGIRVAVAGVYAIRTSVTTVAGIDDEVVAVAGNATNINTVAGSIANVNAVGGNITRVLAVEANEANINAVHANATNINTVSGSIANVNAVGAIDTEVATVAGVSANVTTVAGVSTDVTALGPIATQISTLAAIDAEITAVAAIDDDVPTVAGIASDVSTAATNATAISAVAANETNINAVAGNATNINAAVANETAINAAPQAATDAADARDLAQQWANEDEDVVVQGGEYSAYHWSRKAALAAAGSSDNIANQSVVDGVSVTDALNTLAAAGIPGQIAAFAFNSPPDGWLKANGAAVSRTTYAALFAAIGTTFGDGDGSTTFDLPDLRGEFVRGWDDGRGVDSGRAFGSAQSDQNKEHSHTGSADSGGDHTHTGSTGSSLSGTAMTTTGSSPITGAGYNAGQVSLAHTHTVTINSGGAHTHTLTIDSDGGSEARPRNVALLYCIKY